MSNLQDWLFKKDFLEDVSSTRLQKSSIKDEKSYRKKTIMFIEDLGKEIKCTERKVVLTACVFFHRFYVFHSFKIHNRFNMAVACLFLASKAEEMPIKLRDIVHFYFRVRNPMETASDSDYKDMQKNVLISERILLQTLNFDLNVVHPDSFCLSKLRELKNFIPEHKRKELYQAALTFTNDSYRSTLCLQFPPNQLAYAFVLMGALQLALHPVSPSSASRVSSAEQSWFDLLEKDVDEASMKSICLQLLDLYDELGDSLKCELPDKAAVIKNISAIVGSASVAQVEVKGFRPSPVGVVDSESLTTTFASDTAALTMVGPSASSSNGNETGVHVSPSYDNLYLDGGAETLSKNVTVSAVKTTQSGAPSVPYAGEQFSFPTPTHRPRASSQEMSPSSQSATPQHLPPPADSPAGNSSDMSTFSEANRAVLDTPSHLPPPPETPPASWPNTPHAAVSSGHALLGSTDEEYLASADYKRELGSASAPDSELSMSAPKRARVD